MNHGFIKVATATPLVKVADSNYNVMQMLPIIKEANEKGVAIIAFPELGITSYSCGDLFQQPLLHKKAEQSLATLISETSNYETIIVAGMPLAHKNRLLNCAVILHKGTIAGIVAKSNYPSQSESGEERWFTSGENIIDGETITLCGQETALHSNRIFDTGSYTFAVEIGENTLSPQPVGTLSALRGAEIIISLAANSEVAGKHSKLIQSYRNCSERSIAGYVYSSCGFGESTSDAVFSGTAFIAENGTILAKNRRFATDSQLTISEIDTELLRHKRRVSKTFAAACKQQKETIGYTRIAQQQVTITELTRSISTQPFIPEGEQLNDVCSEILSIQALGLAKRIEHTNAKSCVIGISGGLDSTLALLVIAHAFDILKRDHKDIIGVTMPGFGTTDRTYTNALKLMESLGITVREIPIREACKQHFCDIGHDISIHDVTYENSQARERTQILMDISNQTNGFVVGTGDLSELALGWATYNGDQMSMYGVNASVPKTLVQHLTRWAAANIVDSATGTILLDIVDTPISPELTPADENGEIKQKTEDLVGPYELHDFFLYNFMQNGYSPAKIYYVTRHAFAGKYDDATIKKWFTIFFRRFFTQQFKRSCMPDGPQVSSCTLSPRGGWQMPSDASYAMWMEECENI